MSEVELTCLGDTAHIRDLGLKMVRGARVLTSLTAISKSQDLEIAKAQGLVAVRVLKAQIIRKEDFLIVSSPTEPSTNQRAITRSAHHPATEGPEGPIAELLHEIRGLREDMQKRPLATLNAQLMTAITDSVRDALRGLRLEARGGEVVGSTVLVPEPERFIPRGIVTGTAKAEIQTTHSVAPSTSGLDDADAALREARRRKKDGDAQ
jgi:hypothetical protein